MEALFAICIGVLSACGSYLLLRGRTFPVVVGLGTLLGRYRKYRDAPASPAGAPGPSGAR